MTFGRFNVYIALSRSRYSDSCSDMSEASAQHCPLCHAEGRFLAGASQHVDLNFYRCDKCEHVWTTPKDADGPIRHVTPPRSRWLQVPAAERLRSQRIRRPLPLEAEQRRLVRQTMLLAERMVLLIQERDVHGCRALREHLHTHRDEFAAYVARRRRKRAPGNIVRRGWVSLKF